MTDSVASDPKRRELEELLPFYANGRIAAADRKRVEAALASDADLAARLEIIRDDMAETVLLNEHLGAPSPRALDKLMAGIEAEQRPAPLLSRATDGLSKGFLGWLGGLLAANTLRTIGWRVDIFERSPHALDSRGGGIVLQPDVLHAFHFAGIRPVGALGVASGDRIYLDRAGNVVRRDHQPQTQTS